MDDTSATLDPRQQTPDAADNTAAATDNNAVQPAAGQTASDTDTVSAQDASAPAEAADTDAAADEKTPPVQDALPQLDWGPAPEAKKKPKRRLRKSFIVIAAAVVVLAAVGAWAYNMFSTRELKGIDVSNYQGNISWRAIAENGTAKFVYIKATEGMTYQDPYFKKNWEGAAKQGIPAGAYHFFTLTSTGQQQAENFISMVPKQKGKLPPAIDIETKIVNESQLKSELADYVSAVTKYYGQKPVFYVSSKVYNILYDMYPGYEFWVINYDGRPAAKGWTFWQYSEKGASAGIDGKIDLDIYRGSLWKFNSMLSK